MDPTYCEWGALVGGRIRRLRRARRVTLHELAQALKKPDGRSGYSAGFMSRLERGRTAAALYVYLAIADALEVDPGILLGPEAVGQEFSDGETMLLRYLREVGIEPHEALARLTEIKSS